MYLPSSKLLCRILIMEIKEFIDLDLICIMRKKKHQEGNKWLYCNSGEWRVYCFRQHKVYYVRPVWGEVVTPVKTRRRIQL